MFDFFWLKFLWPWCLRLRSCIWDPKQSMWHIIFTITLCIHVTERPDKSRQNDVYHVYDEWLKDIITWRHVRLFITKWRQSASSNIIYIYINVNNLNNINNEFCFIIDFLFYLIHFPLLCFSMVSCFIFLK